MSLEDQHGTVIHLNVKISEMKLLLDEDCLGTDFLVLVAGVAAELSSIPVTSLASLSIVKQLVWKRFTSQTPKWPKYAALACF